MLNEKFQLVSNQHLIYKLIMKLHRGPIINYCVFQIKFGKKKLAFPSHVTCLHYHHLIHKLRLIKLDQIVFGPSSKEPRKSSLNKKNCYLRLKEHNEKWLKG